MKRIKYDCPTQFVAALITHLDYRRPEHLRSHPICYLAVSPQGAVGAGTAAPKLLTFMPIFISCCRKYAS